ncbi:MAG: serine/threonine protein kinase [Deltaproteobacteria bacterium]|nr:serine/threonine protein kinase [Deltaproteobacteria bacterium]
MRSIEEITPGLVLGRYECLLPIARGGQAAVWAARVTGARGFEKIVAVKAMLPGLSEDSNFERMFLDEARIASNIKHPNVVEILDLGEHGPLLYLVMEFVEGETLYDLIHLARKTGIPGPLAIKIVMDVCAGLHAAHELKENGVLLDIVHRDVSPQNVMISETGIVKMVDFGVARIKGRLSQATADGYVKGKTNFLSPEQISGKSIDRRTDIFAIGVMLYQLTTGKHPFRGETEGQTLNNILRCRLRKPSTIIKGYPENLETVVVRALEREPEFRFQTAQDLYKALDATLTGMTRATSEDIAAFVKPLIGERVEAFRTALNQARKTASAASAAAGTSPSDAQISGLSNVSSAMGNGLSKPVAILGDPSSAPSAPDPSKPPALAPAPPPIVHTPTAGGGASVSAALAVHARRRRAPAFVVAGVLIAAAAILLVARWKMASKQPYPAGLPTVATLASPQPQASAGLDGVDAGTAVAEGTDPASSASAAGSAPVVAAASADPVSKTPQKNVPRKGKGGKGDKKWTPPVTESGL